MTVDIPPGEYIELQDGWWPLLVPLIFIVAIVAWFYTTFWRAMGIGLAVFFLVGLGLHFLKINIFGRKLIVLQPRKETHHVCISCNEPVKPWR
ncbi:MAG: hypothetical protein JNJ77_03595 [Planctomycetia bacterium]|nr:hypothetical protein [Planctomycetia bacterium]